MSADTGASRAGRGPGPDPRRLHRPSAPAPSRATRPGGVLLTLDGADTDPVALDWATAEAAARGAPLRLVQPIPVLSLAFDPWVLATGRPGAEASYAQALDALAAAAHRAHAQEPALVVSTHMSTFGSGAAPPTSDTALVVSGRRAGHRRGPGRLALWTARRLHSALVVVRLPGTPPSPRPAPATGTVVAAIDPLRAPEPVLDIAFPAAARRGAGLTILHTWEVGGNGPDLLAEILAPYSAAFPEVEVRGRLVRTPLSASVASGSTGAALIVFGARLPGPPNLSARAVRAGVLGQVGAPVVIVP